MSRAEGGGTAADGDWYFVKQEGVGMSGAGGGGTAADDGDWYFVAPEPDEIVRAAQERLPPSPVSSGTEPDEEATESDHILEANLVGGVEDGVHLLECRVPRFLLCSRAASGQVDAESDPHDPGPHGFLNR